MLYYDRVGIHGGIDVAKSSNSKECTIRHYWFFNHVFEFQDSICNDYHDLMIVLLSLSKVLIMIALLMTSSKLK